MKISFAQIAFSTCGLLLGTLPGFLLWQAIDPPVGFVIFNCIVGAFIGFALTLPSVSGTRVLGGVASAIVAHNTSEAQRG